MKKDYRYGWAEQQAEKQYDIYTGITDDPYKRYMTGYAYYQQWGKSYHAADVEEFFQEEMPPVPKDFPYDADLWSAFHERLQINALYQAAGELEAEKGWEITIVNRNNAVGPIKKDGYEESPKELFTQWAVNCWINKTNDVAVWTDGVAGANCYSKKMCAAIVKSLKSADKSDAKVKKQYLLKKKKAQLASELKEVESLLNAWQLD